MNRQNSAILRLASGLSNIKLKLVWPTTRGILVKKRFEKSCRSVRLSTVDEEALFGELLAAT